MTNEFNEYTLSQNGWALIFRHYADGKEDYRVESPDGRTHPAIASPFRNFREKLCYLWGCHYGELNIRASMREEACKEMSG